MRIFGLINLLHLFSFLLALPGSSHAQVAISGKVFSKSGGTLPGVNIWIKGTYDGASTDASGSFSFSTPESDSLVLVVSAIGYELFELWLRDATANIAVTLKAKVTELNAVSITAGSIEISDKANANVMKPIDILTTAGAVGDITGALSTLPGTATVANDGRLFVRGGDASETAIFFDGLRVGNAYGTTTTNLPTRNRFSPALFKGTFFSTGGYSAEYGDALSSVLVLETVDEPVRSQVDLSFMTVGGSASATLAGKKQSITAEVSFTDLAPYQNLVSQDFDWERAPLSYSGQTVYRRKWGKDGRVKAFFQGARSSLVLWVPQPGQETRGLRTGIDNDFLFANVSYRKPISAKLIAEGGASLSANNDLIELGANRYRNKQNLAHLKQKFTHYSTDAFKIRFGGELFIEDFSQRDELIQRTRQIGDTRSAIFAEAEWYASPLLTLRAGWRTAYSSRSDGWSFEPRLAAAFKPYKQATISLATGIFSQSQQPEIAIVSPGIANAQAVHYQLSFQHEQNGRIIRTEAYYKPYDGLHLLDAQGDLDGADTYSANGAGMAGGVDFFYRDNTTFKSLDYWITYSYVHSRRQYGSFKSEVQPSFAPSHNLSVVGKYWIARWKSQPGVTLSANSGYTYDNPNLKGEMESVSPSFVSLSVNWSYLVRQNLIVHFSCTNVTGRDNIFGYRYDDTAEPNGSFAALPQRQAAPRFIFIGVFWTLSSDKHANQLNNL
jgi:hypothetical protein